MIRLLFLFLVFLWLVTMLRRTLAWVLGSAAKSAGQQQDTGGPGEQWEQPKRLVRDPVCGTHIAEDRALAVRSGGEIVHFCSAACRDRYAVSAKKTAANR